MNYEMLIFESASSAVNALVLYFVVIMILDYVRTMLFPR